MKKRKQKNNQITYIPALDCHDVAKKMLEVIIKLLEKMLEQKS